MTNLKECLDGWAALHGLVFAWVPEHEITYTRSRGAWHLSTRALNGRDDWISVHPGPPIELQLVADAGHVEVERVSLDELAERLGGVLSWFDEWHGFLANGPGQGH